MKGNVKYDEMKSEMVYNNCVTVYKDIPVTVMSY